MEKEASVAVRQKEQWKQEKEDLLWRIDKLTSMIRTKMDDVNEKEREKVLLTEEVVRYREEIKNTESLMESLNKQLDQRFSIIFQVKLFVLLRLSFLSL